ncbi:hypothetical protein TNIN_461881 [Trichonephila inaurata madagascariensis]|uniref:Uncharacterized protein n=1 Tax=Trichonephila inaurata madagascariensis TaxID=2747483 RepID=A0A8X6JS75_9ARAC|nr:hypothetical protein TNIN_461881 [Trichonephila inaurata madagascariensis]
MKKGKTPTSNFGVDRNQRIKTLSFSSILRKRIHLFKKAQSFQSTSLNHYKIFKTEHILIQHYHVRESC